MRIFDLKRFSVWLAFVIVLAALLFIGTSANAQVVYGQQTFNGPVTIGGTSAAHASASLDIQGTTKGLGIPRMTTAQMNAIASPTVGLTIYNRDSSGLCFYSNTYGWRMLNFANFGGSTPTLQQVLAVPNGGVLNQDNNINVGNKKLTFERGDFMVRAGADNQLGFFQVDTNLVVLNVDSQSFGFALNDDFKVAYLGNLDQSFGLGFWRTPKLFKFDGGKLHYAAAPTATDSTGIDYVYVSKADTIYKMALSTLLGYAGGGGDSTTLQQSIDNGNTVTNVTINANNSDFVIDSALYFRVYSYNGGTSSYELTDDGTALIRGGNNTIQVYNDAYSFGLNGASILGDNSINSTVIVSDSLVLYSEGAASHKLTTKYNPDSSRFDIKSNLPVNVNGVIVYPNGNVVLPMLGQYADDTAAGTGGVPVGGLYVDSAVKYLRQRE